MLQNDVTGLAFVRATSSPYDYRLGAGCTANDVATTSSQVDVDNEGDPRPIGADTDVGADEYK